jgi:hypothetical protein
MRTTATDIDQLNSFLRSEMSAVANYGQAIDQLNQENQRSLFSECRSSHAHRVSMLRRQISSLGGTPSDEIDFSDSTAPPPSRPGSRSERARAVIIAIDECEHRDHSAYKVGLGELTAPTQLLVLRQFLPEQDRTRAVIGRLKRQSVRPEAPDRRVGRGRNVAIGALAAGLLGAVFVFASGGC